MSLQIRKEYLRVRAATVSFCDTLLPEDYVVQPADFVSPPKWHLGHTTWFFETFLLKEYLQGYSVVDPDFNYLFNSYYETIGDRVARNHRGLLFRPTVEEVFAYRAYVDNAMQQLLDRIEEKKIIELTTIGIQHEQQHQELLQTDIKYIFAQHPLLPVCDLKRSISHLGFPKDINWLKQQEGIYEIGYEGEGFCFDNELPKHRQFIQNFEIMDRPVTNGEYLEFIEAGGYTNFRYWLQEGWQWLRTSNVSCPMYWHLKDGKWCFFHFDGLRELDPDLPAMHLSYFVADAYANWKGLHLPTEFEWEAAARTFPQHFRDIVWQWTRSAYLPYPGYTVAPGAIGEYNGKFMINQMVLRGGSFATPQGHSRVSYRNFFHPQMQWQFAGVRLIRYL